MRTRLAALCLGLSTTLAAGCRAAPADPARFEDPELIHAAIGSVTEAMMEIITSPPVAARAYAYSTIAAYEALRHGSAAHPTLAGRLKGLEPVPAPPAEGAIMPTVSGVSALLTVSEALVFAPAKVVAHREALVDSLRREGIPRELIERSMEYGAGVGRHVLAWAGKDGIKAARSAPRLEIVQEPGRWVPTPPAYFDAVEPNWGMLRPFAMDSGGQAPIAPHAPYDPSEGSEFARQVAEVYETTRNLTPEQRHIAAFWDCNPFVMQTTGHIMSSTKKISPGGHWMGITAIATRKTGADPVRTADAYARVSMALSDGFVAAWKEKYRSVRLRPETAIQERLDPSWRPLLQTPPFPEYPSGHSVISSAAAEVLTDLFGDNFAFRDDTEVRFGIPARDFTSFRQAAEEAAISRLYGGIHFRDGIENGVAQGRLVGQMLVSRLGGAQVRLASTAR